MNRERARRFLRTKMLASAVLVILYAGVVFSIPAERLAWQAPHVMGTLLLPKPSPGPYVRSDAMRDNAYSSFNLLAFFSVLGILGLVARNLSSRHPGPGGKRAGPPVRPQAGEEAATGATP